MAKILITESVHPIGPELLTAAGHTVVYADRDMDIIRREDSWTRTPCSCASSSCPVAARDGEEPQDRLQARRGLR